MHLSQVFRLRVTAVCVIGVVVLLVLGAVSVFFSSLSSLSKACLLLRFKWVSKLSDTCLFIDMQRPY